MKLQDLLARTSACTGSFTHLKTALLDFYCSGVGSFTLARVAQCSQLTDIKGLATHVPKYTTNNTACNDTYLTFISRLRLTTENETMLARKHQ